MVSTAAFRARVRGSAPGFGGLKETKMFLPHPCVKVGIVGSLRDREVACSASDRQGSNFESCVGRTVSSQSSHHPYLPTVPNLAGQSRFFTMFPASRITQKISRILLLVPILTKTKLCKLSLLFLILVHCSYFFYRVFMQILTSFIVNILALKMHPEKMYKKKIPGACHRSPPAAIHLCGLGNYSFPTRCPSLDFSNVGKYAPSS